jgi:CelD/BcsL family acetyltransferase involved in cellulose biosynthesis
MPNSNPAPHPDELRNDVDAASMSSGPSQPVEPAIPAGQSVMAGAPTGETAGATRWPPAASAVWKDIGLQVFDDLSKIEQDWTTFERAADCTVFQAFGWLAKWQEHIGARKGTVPAIVLGRHVDGHLLFILQLAIERRELDRRLTWLGSELCDYNAPLLAEDFSKRVDPVQFVALWREIIELLRTQARFQFDLIDLQRMPATIGAQRNPFLSLPTLPHPSGAYIATLAGDWEKFYAAKRSSSTRKRERRQFKHLAEHGEVRFVDVADRADIQRTLETLILQKSASFARMGVEDMFARPGYREFFLDVATDHSVRALTHVSRLDVGSTAAATNLGLKFRDSYYLVLSSYQDGELSRFGPGRAHLHELLRHAIEQGFARFDFTVGDEDYKRDWSDTELQLYDYLAAVTVRGWLTMAVTSTFRRTKRFIKQTPVLWSVFSKLRAHAGWLGPR